MSLIRGCAHMYVSICYVHIRVACVWNLKYSYACVCAEMAIQQGLLALLCARTYTCISMDKIGVHLC
jgi:hypothetical protein